MGNGFFDGRNLHLVVTAQFDLVPGSPDDLKWVAMIDRTSAELHAATFGQVQLGTVYVASQGLALVDAEVQILDQEVGESTATIGGFGEPAEIVTLTRDALKRVHLPMHELAHHVWTLYDEYQAGGPDREVKVNQPASGLRTIQIIGSVVPGELVGSQFYMVHPDHTIGRKKVISNTAGVITLEGDLPWLPSAARDDRGFIQPASYCGHPTTSAPSSFCVMENVDLEFVTDFCDAVTHVTDPLTMQEFQHGRSCWNTIIGAAGFELLTPPPGPAVVQALVPATIVRLEQPARVALVIDVSGSMQGEKLHYAKAGVAFWLENLIGTTDQISIVSFRDQPDVVLPLSPGTTLDPAALTVLVGNLTAAGQTNIRDALLEGISQISSAPGVAAVQAVVLLTDGKHNRPPGTSVTEVRADLRAGLVKLAAIGLGPVDDLDMEELNGLALGTNGFSGFVETDADPTVVESAMIAAQMQLFGNVFELATDVVPPPPSAALRDIHPSLERLFAHRLDTSLTDVMTAVGEDIETVLRPNALRESGLVELFTVHPFVVEEGCESINACINFRFDDRFHIWLLDPTGQEVASTAENVRMSGSQDYPHRFCAVTAPAAGRWHAVILRRSSELAARDRVAAGVRLSVGGRHRAVTAVARTRRAVYRAGESVVFEAGAHWRAKLTGLEISAVVHGPGGSVRRLRLHDGGLLTPEAGTYLGEYRPEKPGRHTALVRIVNQREALRADTHHRIAHAAPDVVVDMGAGVGPFQRVVPLTFEVLQT